MPSRPPVRSLAPPGATGRSPAQKAAKRFYDSARCQNLRAQVLREEPLCRFCPTDRPSLSTTAHHVKPLEQYPELALVRENLVGCCASCHNGFHKGSTLAGGLRIPADPTPKP